MLSINSTFFQQARFTFFLAKREKDKKKREKDTFLRDTVRGTGDFPYPFGVQRDRKDTPLYSYTPEKILPYTPMLLYPYTPTGGKGFRILPLTEAFTETEKGDTTPNLFVPDATPNPKGYYP